MRTAAFATTYSRCSPRWVATSARATVRWLARAASSCRSRLRLRLADYLTITRERRGRRIEPTDPGRSLLAPQADDGRAAQGRPAIRQSIRQLTKSSRSGSPTGTAPPRDDDPTIEGLEVDPAEVTLRPGDEQRSSCGPNTADGRCATSRSGRNSRPPTRQWRRSRGRPHQGGRSRRRRGHGMVFEQDRQRADHSPYARTCRTRITPKSPPQEFHRRAGAQALQLCACRRRRRPTTPRSSAAPSWTRSANCRQPMRSRAFLADQSPEKRDRLIDSLLARAGVRRLLGVQVVGPAVGERHAAAARGGEGVLRLDPRTRDGEHAVGRVRAAGRLGPRRQLGKRRHEFLRAASGPGGDDRERRQAFLGLSIGCAKCHNHPLEKWTNDQYYAMANMFARVRAKGWGGEPRNGDGARTLFVAERRRFGSAVEGQAAAAGAARRRAARRGQTRPTAANSWPSGSRRRRIRISRGRSPIACGPISSASGWWRRSTTCGSPTRPATKSCCRGLGQISGRQQI